jgi:cation diffusion facilitator CzcD-associated flavoprotein CzcO
VPAHTYQYSWEPNPRWSKFYAPGSEILQYLKDVVAKHDLRKYMNFNHKIVAATWSDELSQWQLKIEARDERGNTRTFDDSCDFFAYGVGVLNHWQWPDLEGLQSFKGELMHTAEYNEKVDLQGKTVAVIGNGASAVQTVAAIQPGMIDSICCISPY